MMQAEGIKRAVVVGMGIMGPDIALAFALKGIAVAALDTVAPSLEKARKRLADNIRLLVEQGAVARDAGDAAASRIQFTLDWDEAIGPAQYVTEAVPENFRIKQDVFRKCDERLRKDVVVASNTSSMIIEEISSEMKHPERAVVTHWFIPAHLMPVVEVVSGKRTTPETVELASGLLQRIGKRPVVCRENPAFVHNYIQASMFLAALTLVEKGICSAEDVDAVIQNSFALRLAAIGPIRMADYAGLDTGLNLFRYVYGKTGDPLFKPPQILEDMVARGDLGMKSGKGFYAYSEDEAEYIRKLADVTVLKIKEAVDCLKL